MSRTELRWKSKNCFCPEVKSPTDTSCSVSTPIFCNDGRWATGLIMSLTATSSAAGRNRAATCSWTPYFHAAYRPIALVYGFPIARPAPLASALAARNRFRRDTKVLRSCFAFSLDVTRSPFL